MKRIEAKPEKRDQVEARIKASECLICGTPGKLRRGQCPSCYGRFRRRLALRPRAEQRALEREAIRDGLILGVQQVRAIRENPFDWILKAGS